MEARARCRIGPARMHVAGGDGERALQVQAIISAVGTAWGHQHALAVHRTTSCAHTNASRADRSIAGALRCCSTLRSDRVSSGSDPAHSVCLAGQQGPAMSGHALCQTNPCPKHRYQPPSLHCPSNTRPQPEQARDLPARLRMIRTPALLALARRARARGAAEAVAAARDGPRGEFVK